MVLIIVSYFTLWKIARASTYLKTNLIPQAREREKIEQRMTRTLIIICLCFLIFVGPIYLCSLFGITGLPYLLCFMIYWLQYTTNFIIYAARSMQYRKAYIEYMRTALPWLFKKKKRNLETIFIISQNHRRFKSAPELNFQRDSKSISIENKFNVSLTLKFEYILVKFEEDQCNCATIIHGE